MGHHIFLWRIEHASPGGSLEIKENYFGSAEAGAAVYSLISPEAEAQVHAKNNVYAPGAPLLIHWGGENFTELEAYKAKTGKDHGSTYGKTIL